jgi:hypothetical protein
MTEDLFALVTELRMTGGDNTSIEVKAAAGGLPDSLASTLCALANMPGGTAAAHRYFGEASDSAAQTVLLTIMWLA